MKWFVGMLTVVACVLTTVAEAAPIRFTGTLSGLNEFPTTPSLGTGSVFVEFDPDANTLFISATFSGLTGTTTAAHIHCCAPPGANASVATTTPSFVGFPLGVTSGSFTTLLDTTLAGTYRPGFITANGGTPASAEAALFAGMIAGQSYFNIHTSAFGGGEIRADLQPMPEPATLVLFGLGLSGIALARRRARRMPSA